MEMTTTTPQASAAEQRPLGELFTELTQQTRTLVRKEVELARIEMTTKAKLAGRDAALVAGGGAVALLGVLCLLAALVLVLAMIMPLWASALLVGVVVCGIGLVLATSGIRRLQGLDPKPRQTVETLREDRQWLSEQMSR